MTIHKITWHRELTEKEAGDKATKTGGNHLFLAARFGMNGFHSEACGLSGKPLAPYKTGIGRGVVAEYVVKESAVLATLDRSGRLTLIKYFVKDAALDSVELFGDNLQEFANEVKTESSLRCYVPVVFALVRKAYRLREIKAQLGQASRDPVSFPALPEYGESDAEWAKFSRMAEKAKAHRKQKSKLGYWAPAATVEVVKVISDDREGGKLVVLARNYVPGKDGYSFTVQVELTRQDNGEYTGKLPYADDIEVSWGKEPWNFSIGDVEAAQRAYQSSLAMAA